MNVTSIQYNYALRIEGQNRGKFSFSILPFHTVYQFMDWSDHLSLDVSIDFLIPESVTYSYTLSTNEITLEFDYIQSLESLVTKATLYLGKNSTRLLQES
jgi:hypothetical protein